MPKRLPTAPLAYNNPEFMHSKAARSLRIMAEYYDPLVKLRRAAVGDAVVIFGSARLLPRGMPMVCRSILSCNRIRPSC